MNEIHIIAPFQDANGGDWRAIDLYLTLSSNHQVKLWCAGKPNVKLAAQYPIQEIKPYQALCPTRGELIVVGCITPIGHWYDHAQFSKVTLINNLFDPALFYRSMHRLTRAGKQAVQIQYVSEMLRKSIGLPGDVIGRGHRPENFLLRERTEQNAVFTVGRVSRDVINKHHFDDPSLYRSLAQAGMMVRIVGGTCLRPWLDHEKNISLMPEQLREEIPAFLNSLDCFVYRTGIGYKEASGGVVSEAMKSGLPVVCNRVGGYAELIDHGINGFLFDTIEEAIEIIKLLRDDTQLRQTISSNARNLLQHS
jgi:glycosyltransferase involved in cell wall biosynthesis